VDAYGTQLAYNLKGGSAVFRNLAPDLVARAKTHTPLNAWVFTALRRIPPHKVRWPPVPIFFVVKSPTWQRPSRASDFRHARCLVLLGRRGCPSMRAQELTSCDRWPTGAEVFAGDVPEQGSVGIDTAYRIDYVNAHTIRVDGPDRPNLQFHRAPEPIAIDFKDEG
jgi:hypothetical protein